MKSGIVTRSDPYLMDPSILVDPNLILDYGSSAKGTSADNVNAVFCQVPSYNDLTGRSILDEVLFNYPCNDPWLDLIHCNDTQLENIILDSGLSLCGVECDIGTVTSTASLGYTGGDWSDNEFDLDEVLSTLKKELNSQLEGKSQVVVAAVKQEPSANMSTSSFIESDIANFEEVATTDTPVFASEESQSMISDDTFEEGNATDDLDSVHSFSTQASELPRSTRKRKISTESVESSATEVSLAPKRRKAAARRNKRVQDERVKKQNKLAAMKYRKKKRDEKLSLDDVLKVEEDRNTRLKESFSELSVEVQVLKELLGKYLSPSQLKASKR